MNSNGEENIKKVHRSAVLAATVILIATLLSAGSAQAAFSITKTVDIADPNPGDYIVFTINLGNTPRSELSGATLTDDMSSFEEVTYTYTRTGSGQPSTVPVGPLPWTGTFKDFTGSSNPRNYTVREIKIRARVPEGRAGQDIPNEARISKQGIATKTSSVTVHVQTGAGAEAPQIFTSYAKSIPALYENRVEPNVLLLLDTSGSMTYESDSRPGATAPSRWITALRAPSSTTARTRTVATTTPKILITITRTSSTSPRAR